jgi:hypothetical protein
MNEPSYPLKWPLGWPRSKWTSRSKFGNGRDGALISSALDFLEAELGRLGASNYVVSTNSQSRLDGKPRGDQRSGDTGVAVYFTLKQRRTVLACDKWDRVPDNIWAVAKHIEAMRGQVRWGVGSVEQAFAGYAALNHRTGPSCWEVLGFRDGQVVDEAAVLNAWRTLANVRHPDKPGGSNEAMTELNAAKDTALSTIRNRK